MSASSGNLLKQIWGSHPKPTGSETLTFAQAICNLKKKKKTLHGEGNSNPLQYSCLENPMNRGLWWAAVHGVAKNQTERLHFHFSLPCLGEGNGNPLQCSCLENPRDGGAWWAAVCGVTQSRTWLKRLSSSSSSNFGMLQRAPETSQREILNNLSSFDMLTTQEVLSEGVMNLPKLYYMLDVTVRYSSGRGRKEGERDGICSWPGGDKSQIDTTGLEPQGGS